MTKISVVIKALNEEDRIARAIESSLAAVAPFGGEVVLADSASTDRTVEIAHEYPVKIVQLANPDERSCGIGPELGARHAEGEFIYILDGDMELRADFIREAIDELERTPDLAGVGGFIRENNVSNLEFRGRMKRLHEQKLSEPRDVVCLGGGGLYRRKSLDDVAYMSDRNLHGFEEYDLGIRLMSKGWRLRSLPTCAADHYSYTLGTLTLLWRRWRSGSFLGQGELLRAALANNYWPRPVTEIRAFRYSIAVILYWLAALPIALLTPTWWVSVLALVTGPLAIWGLVAWRHGSVTYGLHAVVVWHLSALGMLLGLLQRRRSPTGPIACTVIHTPDEHSLAV